MQFLSIQSFAEFPDLMDDKWCKNPFYVIRLIVFFYFHKGTVYDKASDVAENKVQFASKIDRFISRKAASIQSLFIKVSGRTLL